MGAVGELIVFDVEAMRARSPRCVLCYFVAVCVVVVVMLCYVMPCEHECECERLDKNSNDKDSPASYWAPEARSRFLFMRAAATDNARLPTVRSQKRTHEDTKCDSSLAHALVMMRAGRLLLPPPSPPLLSLTHCFRRKAAVLCALKPLYKRADKTSSCVADTHVRLCARVCVL